MSKKFFLKTAKCQQVTFRCVLMLGLGWMSATPLAGQEQRLSDQISVVGGDANAQPPLQPPGLQMRAQLEQGLQPGEQLIAPGLPKPVAPPQPMVVAGEGVQGHYFTNGNSIVSDPNVIQGHHAGLGHGGHLGHHHGGQTPLSPLGCNLCEENCRMGYYGTVESLWLMREGEDDFSLSRQFRLGGFDYETGLRFSVGEKTTCSDGWEFVYVTPYEWTTAGTLGVTIPPDASALFTSGGIAASVLDPFNDASLHSQVYRSEIQSFELNRKTWAWDVFSMIYGVRFIDFEEDLSFYSEGNGGGDGVLFQQTDNFLMGLHVGGDWMYPLSQRLMVGQRGRIGFAANFFDGNTTLISNGATIIDDGNDDEALAGFLEYGVQARYRLYRSVHLTVGYEFWYIDGVALAVDQPITNVNSAMGTQFFANDELFLHGGSFGVEVWF